MALGQRPLGWQEMISKRNGERKQVPQTIHSPSWLLTGVILGDVKNTDAKNVAPKTLKGLWK